MAAARSKLSAGILLYRTVSGPDPAQGVEVLLGHMGGPFWSRKDAGAWTIPKGEYHADEDPLDAAKREFLEETGMPVPATSFLALGSVRQSGGKIVTVWAALGDLDAAATVSGSFTMEWPPRSGLTVDDPELDRTAWCSPDRAKELLVAAQTTFVDRLLDALDGARTGDAVTPTDPPA